MSEVCPYCGDVDPWTNTHLPWAKEGTFSNGNPEFTPACQCGEVFEGVGTADSFGTARSIAGHLAHPFGKKIYCVNPWHVANPVPV